jgi:hypothetical protein
MIKIVLPITTCPSEVQWLDKCQDPALVFTVADFGLARFVISE